MSSDTLIMVKLPRPAIETGMIQPFLDQFGVDALPEGKELGKLMGNLLIFVDGYDSEDEGLYEIPEVRAFFQKLHEQWPYWLYFCELGSKTLLFITACLLPNLAAARTTEPAPKGSLQLPMQDVMIWVADNLFPFGEMCERAGFTDEQIDQRYREIRAFYKISL